MCVHHDAVGLALLQIPESVFFLVGIENLLLLNEDDAADELVSCVLTQLEEVARHQVLFERVSCPTDRDRVECCESAHNFQVRLAFQLLGFVVFQSCEIHLSCKRFDTIFHSYQIDFIILVSS